jgi:hypothetical protein
MVESCRRLKIAGHDYLSAALPGLPDVGSQRVAELTPAAWANPKTSQTVKNG